jgi:hypothetical protein
MTVNINQVGHIFLLACYAAPQTATPTSYHGPYYDRLTIARVLQELSSHQLLMKMYALLRLIFPKVELSNIIRSYAA